MSLRNVFITPCRLLILECGIFIKIQQNICMASKMIFTRTDHAEISVLYWRALAYHRLAKEVLGVVPIVT